MFYEESDQTDIKEITNSCLTFKPTVMNKNLFKIDAIVENDRLSDNLMSMVMGGTSGEMGCSPQIVCPELGCTCKFKF